MRNQREMSRGPHQPFAKKSLGQNFLVDQNYVRKIIDAVDLKEDEIVVEIGPGRGAITDGLVETGAKVIAIELDRHLAPQLAERFKGSPNFNVVEADATEVDFGPLLANEKAKLVANLPYYISTAILQHLASQRESFTSLVLMFQKEVVDRIAAPAGDSERGFLTVITDAAFSVERLFDVPPNAFRPVPKVTSTVARLTPKARVIDNEDTFRRIVSVAFAQKRKTILNNLKALSPDAPEILERSGIDPRRRAESLTLDEWIALLRAFQ